VRETGLDSRANCALGRSRIQFAWLDFVVFNDEINILRI